MFISLCVRQKNMVLTGLEKDQLLKGFLPCNFRNRRLIKYIFLPLPLLESAMNGKFLYISVRKGKAGIVSKIYQNEICRAAWALIKRVSLSLFPSFFRVKEKAQKVFGGKGGHISPGTLFSASFVTHNTQYRYINI